VEGDATSADLKVGESGPGWCRCRCERDRDQEQGSEDEQQAHRSKGLRFGTTGGTDACREIAWCLSPSVWTSLSPYVTSGRFCSHSRTKSARRRSRWAGALAPSWCS